MLRWLRSRWPALALWTVALAALAVVAGALFVWSGVYNVAASKDHFAITTRIIEVTLRRSVQTRARWIDAPPLDDPDLVRLGAGHFDGGCAPCHGGKGAGRNPIVRKMLPPPPPLSEAAPHWSAAELFWIVKHGLKYTGMPAWVAPARDDEVWAVVAFLRKLPQLDARAYAALARGNAEPAERSAAEIARHGKAPAAVTICARCHDDRDSAPTSRLVPRLAGQSAAYIARALREYADGSRASGIMRPVAAELGEAEIRALAAHYEALSPDADGGRPSVAEAGGNGRSIAERGIPARGIPPCLACHSGRAAASFPLLAGQSAAYLSQQLRLWKRGLRDATAHGAIMAAIARRLGEDEIDAVARYLESASPRGIAGSAAGAIPDAAR